MNDYYTYQYANVLESHVCDKCKHHSLRGFVISIKISSFPVLKYKEIYYCKTCIQNEDDLKPYLLFYLL